jgi:hypothetical protein
VRANSLSITLRRIKTSVTSRRLRRHEPTTTPTPRAHRSRGLPRPAGAIIPAKPIFSTILMWARLAYRVGPALGPWHRSSVRYWIASLRCLAAIDSAAPRSAMVRATFNIRSCARAERPIRAIAFSSNFSPSAEIPQCFAKHFWQHLRVAIRGLFTLISFQLSLPCRNHPCAHCLRIFRWHHRTQFLVLHRRHLDMNIDAIQLRPRNFRHVSLNHGRRAVTLPGGIRKIPARLRVTSLRRRRRSIFPSA